MAPVTLSKNNVIIISQLLLRHMTVMNMIFNLIGRLMLKSWSSKTNRDEKCGKSDGMAQILTLPKKLAHGPYNEKHVQMSSLQIPRTPFSPSSSS